MSDKERLSTEPYKGVRDFYPEDWARLQSMFDNIRTTLRLWGFEEYQASPLERAELYESKTSEEIVNDQTYTFTDRGDRRVTLRPEMTPSLARMIAAKRLEIPMPARWFSIGNRFRYERMQRGRLREFYQIDVDIIGLPGAAAEGEAVVLSREILRALGAQDEDFTIRINSRTLLNAACEALSFSPSQTVSYIGLLDRKNKMSAEDFETKRAEFRMNGTDPLELIEAHTSEPVEAEYQKLAGLLEAFSSRGMTNVIFDPTVVRGFLYYTGLVFEVFDTNPENARSLMGGGRYDGLVSLFGGDPIPAMGFAMGDVTLMDFLQTHGLLPRPQHVPEVYLGTPSSSDIPDAQAVAQQLRNAGVRTWVNVTSKSLGDQIRDADKRGILYFIAVGEEETKSQIVKVKTLAKSEETPMPVSDVPAFIKIL